MIELKKTLFLVMLVLIWCPAVLPQDKTLKEKALDEFKAEHYDRAIELLEQAVKENPEDADIYYYLGCFNHYRAYDSRPLCGHDYSYSERIFGYLDKALELNPDYGNAKYFYGAECSGNAFLAMQDYDSDRLKYFYERAHKRGAYPDWLVEFGKNFMSACEQDAILFTGGNADFDISSYLQLCENHRKDITLVSISMIDRPWYVQFLQKGLKNSARSIRLSLSDRQIMDIHPYKWRETTIQINVSQEDKVRYRLPENFTMMWNVLPDLQSERLHAKHEDEEVRKRTYLSPQRAVLMQIVEDNLSGRPIYFSTATEPSFFGGLEEYFQLCGLVYKLIPFKTKETDFEFDTQKIANLLRSENLKKYPTILHQDLPRISGVAMSGYGVSTLSLAGVYHKQNRKKELELLKSFFEKTLMIGYNKEFERYLLEEINTLTEEQSKE